MNKMSNQFKLLLLSAAVEEANFQEILIATYAKRLRVAKRKHRFWIHPLLNKRKEYGAFYHLVGELELDEEKYIEYFRISPQQLDMLLSYFSKCSFAAGGPCTRSTDNCTGPVVLSPDR